MQWRPIRAAFASSRQKRASSFRLKRSIFWRAKAVRPNSSQRTRPVGYRSWNSMTVHIFPNRSRSAGIWRGFIPSQTFWGAISGNRRMELELFAAIGRTVQNTSPIFQGRFKQFPDYGEAQRTVVYQRLERMDRELNGHQFVAGNRFTIADITALVAIDIGGRLADIKIAPELAHLTRWHNAVSKRPSADA